VLTSAGLASWCLGDLIWVWYELVHGEVPPTPSWSDLWYLLYIPLTLSGMLIRPAGPVREVRRDVLLLEAVVALRAVTARC
jgi:hypothetical protein